MSATSDELPHIGNKFSAILSADEMFSEIEGGVPKSITTKTSMSVKKKMLKTNGGRKKSQRKSLHRKHVGKFELGEKDWENEVAKTILKIHKTDGSKPSDIATKLSTEKAPTARKKTSRPNQIWFSGSGAVHAVWCPLVAHRDKRDELLASTATLYDCDHAFCNGLRRLAHERNYHAYVNAVENTLREWCSTGEGTVIPKDKETKLLSSVDPSILETGDSSITEKRLWQQLLVCIHVFGEKLAEMGRNGPALEMLKRSEELLAGDPLIEGHGYFSGPTKPQLRAFLNDSLSYFYFRRRKFNAAAVYSQKSLKTHVHQRSWQDAAKCYLHGGTILAAMGQHDDSVRCIKQVVGLLEDGKLDTKANNAEMLCMIAVCYHNIAVEQLVLCKVSEACVASQNARRLAGLSLSYSNRWINRFQSTHDEAMRTMTLLTDSKKKRENRVQAKQHSRNKT